MKKDKFIKSPLNYVGGKYRILNQIIPLFPDNITNFVDLFGGGFNVGINCNADTVIYNDIIVPLVNLMSNLNSHSSGVIINHVEKIISEYKLSKENVNGYNALRSDYNNMKNNDFDKSMYFLTLVFYSFNHQIRFNQKKEFNTPFGRERSSFNENIKNNLKLFVDEMHNKNCRITSNDFRTLDISSLDNHSLVYCDPPYLFTTGSYNDGNRGFTSWSIEDQRELLNLLDNLDGNNIKFALSSTFESNGNVNNDLIQWSKRYKVHKIENNFNNSNYRRKNYNDIVEVLITNY